MMIIYSNYFVEVLQVLRDFIFQTLSITDFISPTIKTITKVYMFKVFQRGHY